MSVRGRKPKPLALKKLAGTDQPCRLNPNEPEFPAGWPERPAHLDDAASREWDRLCVELNAVGLLTTADAELVAMLAQEWSRLIHAERALAEGGMIVRTPNDYPMLSPWLAIVRASVRDVLRMLAELGLTPTSRSRVHAVRPRDEDAEFFGDGKTARVRVR